MSHDKLTRREFVRDAAATAAAVAIGLTTTKIVYPGNPTNADTSRAGPVRKNRHSGNGS